MRFPIVDPCHSGLSQSSPLYCYYTAVAFYHLSRSVQGLSAGSGRGPHDQRHVPGEARERQQTHAGVVRPEARPRWLDCDPEEGGWIRQLFQELGDIQGDHQTRQQ